MTFDGLFFKEILYYYINRVKKDKWFIKNR